MSKFKIDAFGREFHVTETDLVHLMHDGVVKITTANGVNLANFNDALHRAIANTGTAKEN